MKRTAISRIAVCTLAFLISVGIVGAQEIVAIPTRPLSVYTPGEKITWNVEVKGQGANTIKEVRYVLKKNGYTVIKEGTLTLAEGKTTLESFMDEPGTILVELKAKAADKEISGLAGAAVSPEKIKPSEPRPIDFDKFWSAKLAELRKIPTNAVLESADSGKPDVEYYKIQMDNIKGSHIFGQLAKPKREGKFPALLIVQWAGVYGLQRDWAVGRAQGGWLTLNIEAHDIPFDKPQDFYDQLNKTTLSNYPAIGNDNRETSYFLRMYLSCYRAAEYLSTRPDWDGRTLVVTGGSQGGLQTVVTAALHPKITAGIADVPAGCDVIGPVANRAPGWPMWYWQIQGKDAEKVKETSRYFDVVNFASRVKCPILVGMGLIDTTCPPSGVFAMTNQLKGRKELAIMPQSGHQGPHDAFYTRSEAWFKSLVKGEAPVIRE